MALIIKITIQNDFKEKTPNNLWSIIKHVDNKLQYYLARDVLLLI